MFDLPPPRHISTLRISPFAVRSGEGPLTEPIAAAQVREREPLFLLRCRLFLGLMADLILGDAGVAARLAFPWRATRVIAAEA